MINTRYDNLEFSQKSLNTNTLNYNEGSSLSFKDVFNTVHNNIDFNNIKEDSSLNNKANDYSKDDTITENKKEVFDEDNMKNIDDETKKKTENNVEENFVDKESVDEQRLDKKNKLKADTDINNDEEEIKLSKNKNKLLSLVDTESLIENIDVNKLSEYIDKLKEKIKSTKQSLKKEDEEEIKNILASLINLKNLIEEAKLEESENKNNKLYVSKNNSKEEAKNINSTEKNNDAKKLISDISEKMKKINDSSLSELKEVKDTLAAVAEKDFKYSDIDKKADTKYSKSKVDSDGRLDNAFSQDFALSKDDVTELTFVKMKDDISSLGDKLNSSFNEAGKTQNSSKIDMAETISKFQDMLTKLVDKAKIAVSEGRSEVVMTLKPDNLGDVRLKLIMEGDKLNAKIFVDNAEVKDIFTKNLDTVITSLNEIDVNIEGFDVMLRQDNKQNQNNENEFNMFERNINALNDIDYEPIKENNNVVIDRYTLEQKKLNILI